MDIGVFHEAGRRERGERGWVGGKNILVTGSNLRNAETVNTFEGSACIARSGKRDRKKKKERREEEGDFLKGRDSNFSMGRFDIHPRGAHRGEFFRRTFQWIRAVWERRRMKNGNEEPPVYRILLRLHGQEARAKTPRQRLIKKSADKIVGGTGSRTFRVKNVNYARINSNLSTYQI